MPQVKRSRPRTPTRDTLRKYGLTEALWLAICKRQGWCCPVCEQPLGDRKLAIDHVHVRGFRKMKPDKRRLYVRGVLHSFCNRYVRGWLTLTRASAILLYLQGYHDALARNGGK